MSKYLPFIKSAIKLLEENNLLESLDKVQIFHDEPKLFYYTADLQVESLLHSHAHSHKHKINCTGYSFYSNELAIAKCLGESLERLCLFTYQKDLIIKKSWEDNYHFYDISHYPNYNKIEDKTLGWVQGYNFSMNTPALLPAQLIYLSYRIVNEEPALIENNSTGAAGGFTHEETLLRGIYEVIERDSFMSIYLGKLKVPYIDLSSIPSKRIQGLMKICDRYNLKLAVFDITTDLKIPVFMTALIDRTGLGPVVRFGLKAGLNKEETIIGSIEESFIARHWLRKLMLEGNSNSKILSDPPTQRGLLWAPLEKLGELNYLLNQTPKRIPLTPYTNSLKKELTEVRKLLKEKNLDIFYADITSEIVKRIKYKVYKIIIPGLQTYYIDEKNKSINLNRLHMVSAHLKQKLQINDMPHPFI